MVGVMRLEGSLTRSRVKFCDSATMRPICMALSNAFVSPAVFMHDDGDGVDLFVLAIALVVVGIEVANESAFHDRAYAVGSGHTALRQSEGKAADALAFQRSHRGAGELAQFRG